MLVLYIRILSHAGLVKFALFFPIRRESAPISEPRHGRPSAFSWLGYSPQWWWSAKCEQTDGKVESMRRESWDDEQRVKQSSKEDQKDEGEEKGIESRDTQEKDK